MNQTRTAVLGVGIAAAVAGALSLPNAAAASAVTLRFSNHLDTIQLVDAAPAGPSAGDSSYIGSHVVSGASGRTGASCVMVTASQGGIKQCEVDFVLGRGTITTRGLTDSAGTTVRLIVTGGTGRYADARGSGTLIPTMAGSDVLLRLR